MCLPPIQDMLEKSADAHLKPTLLEAEAVLVSLEECKANLDADRKRKRAAASVDSSAEVNVV